MPLYQLLEWTFSTAQLSWLIRSYESTIMTAIAILALVMCFVGFYCYRGCASALVLIGTIHAGFIWLYPLYGRGFAATFGAVVGMVLAFLAFRFYRYSAILISMAIAGGIAWVYLTPFEDNKYYIFAIAIAAGLITLLFPLFGVCTFTSLWGAYTFIMEGARLSPELFNELSGEYDLLKAFGVILVAGLICQFTLFSKQKIFPHIMPKGMEYALEKRKVKQGAP